MARFHRLPGDHLTSEQVDLLQKVLDSITCQPWFDDSQHRRDSLVVRLTFLIQIGIVDAAHLQCIGVSWAVKDFSGSQVKASRPTPSSTHLRTSH
ncbi:hypothetical protein GR212_30710 [Rhizobium lusitanum]|uniref:Uncharacterized protein n=1 Tax=Rhizobium lusitanum TaxID=293958 RepID=A0A6L9UDC6_9HYPH|nr:hypothetical protein [Rhizobium lusitanum]NEI73933.1 hypothetical protein [Rhizobium lusitanum]